MKKTSKLLALLMALAMIMSCMVGCGEKTKKSTAKSSEKSGNSQVEKETGIVGTWEGSINMGETAEELAETPLADLEVSVVVDFKADGKMTAKIDTDKDAIAAAMKDYMLDMLKETGMTAEAYAEATGQSIDDSVKELIDEMTEELSATKEGFYKYEDGKLLTRETEDDEWDEDSNFELQGDKMTITEDNMKLELHRK